jgi:predicted phage-related endonuclease
MAYDRRKFLGGTDVAAVLGVSSWTTPVELWQQKVGVAANEPVSEARELIFARGKKLEPFILDMGVAKLRDEGHDVQVIAKNKRYLHPVHRFLSAEIDAELRIDGEETNFDAKSVTWAARKKWGEAGTDQMPIEYLAQFMHGLDVAPGRRRRCLVAALRSFDDVDLYWADRDDETIEGMRSKLVEFWTEHVVTRIPPDPVKFGDIRALFPQSQPTSVEASPEVVAKVNAWKALAAEEKKIKEERERLKFEIAQFMGQNALLTSGVRDLISWETQSVDRMDLRAFKRQHPDWYALYVKTTADRVMRVAAKR